jgi:hypothetical protein
VQVPCVDLANHLHVIEGDQLDRAEVLAQPADQPGDRRSLSQIKGAEINGASGVLCLAHRRGKALAALARDADDAIAAQARRRARPRPRPWLAPLTMTLSITTRHLARRGDLYCRHEADGRGHLVRR